jgi:hypothetical protein
MLSIVHNEVPEKVVSIEEGRTPEETAAPEEKGEFEIVLGSRQVASVLFVATLIFGAFSAIAYTAGKSEAPKPQPAPVSEQAPVIPVASAPATVVSAPEAPKPEPPMFADPKNGAVYLQLGAVEKGIAIIMAEGLRKRQFNAFVGPGPNEHIFRVLIGPLSDESFKRVKDSVDALGLSTFARKYQQ